MTTQTLKRPKAPAPRTGALRQRAGDGPRIIRLDREIQLGDVTYLARKSGVERTHLSRVINGRLMPGSTTMRRLAEALDTDMVGVLNWLLVQWAADGRDAA